MEEHFIPFEITNQKLLPFLSGMIHVQLYLSAEIPTNGFPKRLKWNAALFTSRMKQTVDEKYSKNNEIVSFADGYPFLIIGQASLDDLNSKLEEPLPMNRFRPNIVFTGGEPFQEDEMKKFKINDITFYGVKPCARCVITTTNQETAERLHEPLKTLATYRKFENKVMFGMNLLNEGEGEIKVGDEIKEL